jgi:hypothetical protein
LAQINGDDPPPSLHEHYESSLEGLGCDVDIANELAVFMVVRAASHEAAAKMFEGHPHFTMFPGEAVEVMPLLPVPGA